MILNFVSALLFTVAGGIAGIAKSASLKSEIDTVMELIDIAELCIFRVRYTESDVYGICREIKSKNYANVEFIKKLPDFYSPEENFHQQWHNAVVEQKKLPEKELVLRLGEILGRSDVESQVNSISAIKSELERSLESKNQIYRQKSKLYRSVGLLFGVMVGILVI